MLSDNEARKIIQEHKVFWTTMPIELMVDGSRVKVGITVVLAGTEAEDEEPAKMTQSSILDLLYNLAQWMVPEQSPNVRIEIEKAYNYVFYRPEEFETNTKRYVVGIKILNSNDIHEPYGDDQKVFFDFCRMKLKEIDCPKEHWKAHPV